MKALDNRFYVKFMQLEIGLFYLYQLQKVSIQFNHILQI